MHFTKSCQNRTRQNNKLQNRIITLGTQKVNKFELLIMDLPEYLYVTISIALPNVYFSELNLKTSRFFIDPADPQSRQVVITNLPHIVRPSPLF